MSETCPRCGARRARSGLITVVFQCGSSRGGIDSTTPMCEYAARLCRERDEARADQADWRRGVELIASALGESDPPDLSCSRIAQVALEARAEVERMRPVVEAAEPAIRSIRRAMRNRDHQEYNDAMRDVWKLGSDANDVLDAYRAASVDQAREEDEHGG